MAWVKSIYLQRKLSEMSTRRPEPREMSSASAPSIVQESDKNVLEISGGDAKTATGAPPQLSDHSGYPAAMQSIIQLTDSSVRRNIPLPARRDPPYSTRGEGMHPVSQPCFSNYGHDNTVGGVVRSGGVDGPGNQIPTTTTQGFTPRLLYKPRVEKKMEYPKITTDNFVLIRFPDPELSENVVRGFHSKIENVHFPKPIRGRFCWVKLKSGADVRQVIKDLENISFGVGKLKAENKYERSLSWNVPPPKNFDVDEDITETLMQVKRKSEEERILQTKEEQTKRKKRDDVVDDDDDDDDDDEDDDDDDDDEEEEEEEEEVITDDDDPDDAPEEEENEESDGIEEEDIFTFFSRRQKKVEEM